MDHFGLWHDKAGNAVADERRKPTWFFPSLAPTLTRNAGAVAAIRGFTEDKLFVGQSKGFFDTVTRLAMAADAAKRNSDD